MFVLLMLAVSANAVVNRPVVNLYSGPTEDTDVVSQAIYATNVAVIEESGGWLRVKTPDEYSGWVQASGLLRIPEYARGPKVAFVESLFANIYRETNITKHAPMITVPYETRLEVVGFNTDEDGRWIQVRLPDDRAGWIQRGDITLQPRTLSVEESILFSKRFLGLPYLWGGTSTFGYDCSGFVQMIYRRRGVTLPRDAGPQASFAGVAPVDKEELAPGDLLFFGPKESKITHTGMYIGGGQFINATAHIRPVIQINDLADPHWTRLLVGCRRLK